MAGGIESVQSTIEHVRYPCKRMPVAGVGAEKGPFEACERDAALYDGIVEDVLGIIVIHEFETGDGPEKTEGDQGEQEANDVEASDLRHGKIVTEG